MGSSWSGKRPYVHFFCKKLKSASGCIFKPANEREKESREKERRGAAVFKTLRSLILSAREQEDALLWRWLCCLWMVSPLPLVLMLAPLLGTVAAARRIHGGLITIKPEFHEFSYAFQAEKNLEIECYFAAFESSFWRSDQCEREHCTYSNRQTQNQNCVMTYFPLLLRLCCRCCHRGAVGNGTVEHSSSASPVPPRGDRLLKCRVFERPCPTKRESRRRAVDARRAPPLWKTSILMPWLRSILHGKLLSHPCNCGCF